MKLEYGKRYITRDGRVTGPLVENKNIYKDTYQYFCETLDRSWGPDGSYFVRYCNPCDLIAEYQESNVKEGEIK